MKNPYITSAIVLFPLFGFGWYLWQFTTHRDFGLNFFTEMMGVAITLFVIDFVFRLHKKRKGFTARYLLIETLLGF